MKKKLLTAFLAIVMLVSSIPSAMAAKKDYDDEGGAAKNIFELWGGFEDPAVLSKVYFTSSSSGNECEIVKGGANGTKNCLKYDSSSASSVREIYIDFPTVVGETYDISFYYKTDTPSVTAFHPLISYDDGGWSYLTVGTMSTGWSKYTMTWECTGINTKGEQTSGSGKYQFRFGSQGTPMPCTVYIDEFSVVPYGNVPADYSSINAGFVESEEEEVVETGSSVTQKVEFSDVTGHWAEMVIEDLAAFNYVNGIGNGLYSPEAHLTRAQFIKMVADLYNIEEPKYDGRFKDIKGDEWFAGSYMIADKIGLIDVALKAGGYAKPDAVITREEAASIAAKVAADRGAAVKENATSFIDNNSISKWAVDGVKKATSYGLIKGYADGSYKPANSITRAEAAQILFRIVEISSRMHIYVDAQNGNNKGDGTVNEPLKTIEAARDLAKKCAPSMKNDIKILMRGTFRLNSTLKLDETHSGKNGYSIVYTSWGDEKPVLTMADEYTGFKLHDAEKNIYKLYIGRGMDTRQAYFNNVKGIRARGVGYLDNIQYIDQSYYLCDDLSLLQYEHPTDLELVYHINWCNPRVTVASITETSDGRVRIDPHSYFKWVSVRVNFAAGRIAECPSYIENAYELVDQPGEWYMNKHDGYMYYIPRAGEDMSTMTLKFPEGEVMIEAKGIDSEEAVSNLKFDNICFEGTTWMRPTREGGHADAQNNHIRESKDYVPGAAIHFEFCNNITMTNNIFRQMGVTGVEFMEGSKHVDVIGNHFYDISGTAITVDNIELTGYPSRRTPNDYCEYVRVNNNYVRDVCLDYKSGAAMSFAWPRHSEFNHNEIVNAPYSGFHIGYDWDVYAATGSIMYDVEVNYNRIHNVMADRIYDGGAIYTLGASSLECEKTNTAKNNKMWGNYLYNVWNCGFIYPDQGSTSWYVKDNVIDSHMAKIMEYNLESDGSKKAWAMHMHTTTIMWITTENLYADCDYGYEYGWMNMTESNIEPIKMVKDGQWPEEAKAIMAESGIEPEYAGNFNVDGPIIMFGRDRWQSVPLEKPVFSDLIILDRYNNSYPLSDFEIDWWCEDPEAVTVDENGYITAHKQGEYELEAVATFNGHTYSQHFKLQCGDEIEKVYLNSDKINLIKDSKLLMDVEAHTTFGHKIRITPDAIVDVAPLEDGIVTIEKTAREYILKAIGVGTTTLAGTVTYNDVSYDVNIPVKIISYNSEEGATLPYREFKYATGWKSPGIRQGEGIKVNGSPNHHMGVIDNELVAFDVEVQPGSSWPSFAICDNDAMGKYSSNDCYMIGFKSDHIEFQRFNGGVRTMIFGNSYNPIGGNGIPNEEGNKILEYNKRYSVVIGALETEAGTRVILNINGKNVIDFTDDTTGKIQARGYFVVYNPAPGGMVFYPFSDIKAE
ncbi:MAG: S-layer homology domain-containing protein [Clostridia bacterium]|nr:S-layer homology domain-containing protein [Clostridia bacterium]